MNLLGYLRAEAGRLKRRVVPTGVILMYHRVAELEDDPWHIAVSAECFAQQLEALRARRVHLLGARELAAALAEGRVPKRFAVITFDDGYRDNLDCAKPLLERYEAPATVFVAASEVGRPDGFWWDRLTALLGAAAQLPEWVDLGGVTVRLSASDRAAANRQLWQRLVSEPSDAREAGLAELGRQLAVDPAALAAAPIMGPTELRRLADGGLVEIASHGWSHRPLADLQPLDQATELQRSRAWLEELVGRPVVGLSYPHGSMGADTARLASQAGYAYACSSRPGLVRAGADLFALPRMEMRQTDAAGFERFLADHVLS